jgi:FtsP/CotA-like multicopper oxidase with cupredoxin domain
MENARHQSTYSTFPPLTKSESQENNAAKSRLYYPADNETESLVKRYPNTTSGTPRDADPRFLYNPNRPRGPSRKNIFEPVPRFSFCELLVGTLMGFFSAMLVLFAVNNSSQLPGPFPPTSDTPYANDTDVNGTDVLQASVPMFAFDTVPMLESENGLLQVHLSVELKPQHYVLDGGRVNVSFDARTFNGSLRANGLLVSAGDRVEVWLSNQLEQHSDSTVSVSLLDETTLASGVDDDEQGSAGKNELGWANSTNIHPHGLHVSPAHDGDNVFRIARPGETIRYIFDIPFDHPPGTSWMHPHYHGSSALQTAYAMAMPIVVRDPENSFSEPLARALDIVLMAQNVNVHTGKSKDEQVLMTKAGSKVGRTVHTTGLRDGERLDAIVVNGMDNPLVAVVPPRALRERVGIDVGDVVRMRLINAAIDGVLIVTLQVVRVQGNSNADVTNQADESMCEMWAIAKDGEYFEKPRPRHVVSPPSINDASKDQNSESGTTGDGYGVVPVVVVSGSRVDLVVACAPGYEAHLRSTPKSLSSSALAFLGNETTMLEGPIARVRFSAMPSQSADVRDQVDDDSDGLDDAYDEDDVSDGDNDDLQVHVGDQVHVRGQDVPTTADSAHRRKCPHSKGCGDDKTTTTPGTSSERSGLGRSHSHTAHGPDTPSTLLGRRKDGGISSGVLNDWSPGAAMHQMRLPVPANRQDLRLVPDDKVTRFVFEWSHGGKQTPKLVVDGEEYTMYGINGERFTGKPAVQVRLDSVVEWVVVSKAKMDGSPLRESHPFHLHTNHFQIVSWATPTSQSSPDSSTVGEADESPDFEVGDWRDTIASAAPGNVTIRWRPRDFVGLTVAHCHVLVHEDTGMMVALEIVP